MAVAQDGVGPPGWEKTIKKMKKSGDVDNPWALSWWMKRHHYHPSKTDEDDATAAFDPALQAAIATYGAGGLPQIFYDAAAGQTYAHVLLLQADAAGLPLLTERR